jgi:very-short-patch-repair endonuclease
MGREIGVNGSGSRVSLDQSGPGDAASNIKTQPAPSFSQRRQDLVRNAVGRWTNQLIDLGGRNNLLYYRDLTRGTLDLAKTDERTRDDLLAGKAVRLAKLFATDDARKDAVRRLRTIRGKAQENFEERGLQTLYLACGMATWENSRGTAKPKAPVSLGLMTISAVGASQEDFSLTLGGELEVSPTLLHLLETDFGVTCDLAALERLLNLAEDQRSEIEKTIDWLRQAAAAVPGFAIDERAVIGNFSYAKLPMVNDLEKSIDELIANDLVAAIAGDEEARNKISDASSSPVVPDPDQIPLADEFLVLDADSSQNAVINAALAGASLVVKGPPGTGKSQTIANLITTLVAHGQKVLFVAEKRAAIDAVLKRLQREGLDDLVLDLHDGIASRRKLAQDFARTLHNNGQTPPVDRRNQQRRVESERQRLNQHAAALHAKRDPWEISVYEARAELLGIPDRARTDVRFRGAQLRQFDAETFGQLSDDLGQYAGLCGFALDESDSPWAGVTIASSDEASSTLAAIARLRTRTLPGVLQSLRAAATEVGTNGPGTLADWKQLLSLWRGISATLDQFSPEIFTIDLTAASAALAPATKGLFARLEASLTSREFKEAKKTLRAVTLPGAKRSPADLLNGCAMAQEQLAAWQALGEPGTPVAPANLDVLDVMFEQLTAELTEVERAINRSELARMTTDELDRLLGELQQDTVTLFKLPEIYRLETVLVGAGLNDLLDELRRTRPERDLCLASLRYAWLQSVLENVALSDSAIGAFDANEFATVVNEYRQGDREHVATTAARVRRLCAERATKARDEFKDEADLLQQQASRKRGHLPVRQLFAQTAHVLLELKPCWIMSPLVVSQLLPGRKYFDVVVFDEASQVPPADAVPAILRGARLVVAGDERQLPPTSFFASQTVEDEEADAEVEIEGGTPLVGGTQGMESILEALEPMLPSRTLEWHYRSHDERLIAFSNAYIYDRELTTFPGTAGEDSPIAHVLVPWVAGRPVEEQSSSAEVQKVVELVLQHASAHPHDSLGVIAMGIKHAERIEESLRRAIPQNPELEDFFDETKGIDDRFFVKNLERVQGDERDAIILSIGYSKNENGKLSHNFGPLNKEGGERRLNVAVTRARKRMTLVSSFGSADLDPDRSSAEGVKLLRLYLQYAASRGANLGEAALLKPQLNPFEISVRDALTQVGIPLVAQYGSSGYRIDFVAKHPTRPGRMVLAIECDGASYHSSHSARDRDRLRQDMLELLGWHFHRIWSSEWFHHRDRAVKKALEAYQAAAKRADEDDGVGAQIPLSIGTSDGSSSSLAEPETTKVWTIESSPHIGEMPLQPGHPITDYSRSDLVKLVRWVKSDGLLRTEVELLDEVVKALGYGHRGKRIVAAITEAIQVASEQ